MSRADWPQANYLPFLFSSSSSSSSSLCWLSTKCVVRLFEARLCEPTASVSHIRMWSIRPPAAAHEANSYCFSIAVCCILSHAHTLCADRLDVGSGGLFWNAGRDKRNVLQTKRKWCRFGVLGRVEQCKARESQSRWTSLTRLLLFEYHPVSGLLLIRPRPRLACAICSSYTSLGLWRSFQLSWFFLAPLIHFTLFTLTSSPSLSLLLLFN